LTFEEAVRLLDHPTSLCDGARALAGLGDRRALVPLAQTYERRREQSGACVIEALEALGGPAAAGELAGSADQAERAAGLRLLQLFPDEDQLGLLEDALGADDADVRRRAGEALRSQWRTPDWRAAVERAAGSEHEDVRRVVRALLAELASPGDG
jgi:hypothetical protein